MNPLTIQDIKNFLNEKDIDKECILLSSTYNTVLSFRCNLCGKTFERSVSTLKNSSLRHFCCPDCSLEIRRKKRALSIESVQEFIISNDIQTSLISTEYKNSKTPLKFLCGSCGELYEQSFSAFKKSPRHICPKCSRIGNSHKISVEQANEIFEKDGYIILGEYVDSQALTLVRCPNQHEFFTSYNLFKNRDYRCPFCYKENHHGKNCYQWKGGITSISAYLRNSISDWKKVQLQKAGFKCDITGRADNLIVHHLNVNFSDIVQQAFINTGIQIKPTIKDYSQIELDRLKQEVNKLHNSIEGIVLTKDIHILFHKTYGYKNNNKRQYLEFKEKFSSSL